ncbi:MAG: CRISPR system precrRNA processing endoribonuclease RAMP protein Cas6, partial [Heliobacteriaceae bacterium]|nr:CRISPR system precrRNA processing endoribonuclease RAMP protein Cas6 [Heliobacteriaceae bacterium]
EIAEKFHQSLLKQGSHPFPLGKNQATIADWVIASNGDGWCRVDDYENLYARGEATPGCTLRILTPLSFRKGVVNSPFPEPKLMFQSWLARWENFAPPNLCLLPEEKLQVAGQVQNSGLAEFLELIGKNVGVADFRLSLKTVDFGNYRIKGSVGMVRLDWHRLAPDICRYLDVLSRFAHFAGCGYKCTMGLGQVTRI